MNTNKLMAALPDMAAFVLVVEEGSFSAAAEQLGMTPSAVSRQISRLESVLNVRLLERTTRRQSTTAEGKKAYSYCRVVMDAAQEVSQVSQQRDQLSGRICIAAPKAYSKWVLQPLVLAFLEQYPEIDLHFRVTDTFLNPLRDDVDVVFRLQDHLVEGLVNVPLHRIESFLCASPSYTEQRGLLTHPEQLSDHSCIALGEYETDNHWLFKREEETAHCVVHGRYTSNHSEMRLQAVQQNLGIGLFPDFVVRTALAQGEVVRVLSDWNVVSKYQGMVSMQYMQNNFMPNRLRVLLDFFKQKLGKPTDEI